MFSQITRTRIPPILSGLILGVAGSLIGGLILLHFFTDTRRLTTRTNPTRTVVVKSNQVDKLRVNFDAIPINQDITIVEVAIWNQGNLAIKKSDILEDVVISTAGKVPILAATLPRVTRKVTGLRLNTDEMGKGNVQLTWDILEKNDGCAVQLTYVGNPEIAVVVDGIVEGQASIERIESTSALTIWRKGVGWLSVLLAVLFFVLKFIQFLIRKIPQLSFLEKQWPDRILVVASFSALVAWLLLGILSRQPVPPV